MSLNGGYVYGLPFAARSKFWSDTSLWQDFYLQPTFEKMCAFAFFTNENLRSYGCNGANFTAAVNCTNPHAIECSFTN